MYTGQFAKSFNRIEAEFHLPISTRLAEVQVNPSWSKRKIPLNQILSGDSIGDSGEESHPLNKLCSEWVRAQLNFRKRNGVTMSSLLGDLKCSAEWSELMGNEKELKNYFQNKEEAALDLTNDSEDIVSQARLCHNILFMHSKKEVLVLNKSSVRTNPECTLADLVLITPDLAWNMSPFAMETEEHCCPWKVMTSDQGNYEDSSFFAIVESHVMNILRASPGSSVQNIHLDLPMLNLRQVKLLVERLILAGIVREEKIKCTAVRNDPFTSRACIFNPSLMSTTATVKSIYHASICVEHRNNPTRLAGTEQGAAEEGTAEGDLMDID